MTDTVNKQALERIRDESAKETDYPGAQLARINEWAEQALSTPPTTPVQGYREAPDIELALLLIWANQGIEEIYKYKHRVKAYHERRHNSELFYDLTCGTLFQDIPDVANGHPTIPYHDITPEDCKVSVAELIQKRKALSQPDSIGIDVLTAQLTDEVQQHAKAAANNLILRGRLKGYREALEWIVDNFDSEKSGLSDSDYHRKMLEIARQALSQPDTQPSGADKVRELWDIAGEVGNERYRTGMSAALKHLGITIPGINSTEDQPGPSGEEA